MEKTKIVFLFGSGISIKAGMPSTEVITNKVLNFNSNDSESKKNIVNFLNLIRDDICNYYRQYKPEREVSSISYEDIYFFIDEIYQSHSGNYENPALKCIVDKIKSGDFFENKLNSETSDLNEFLEDSLNYILKIIFNLLNKNPDDLSYLDFLKDAVQDDNINSIDVFTLNHDLVIESFLQRNQIEYDDGFDKHDLNHSMINENYWDPSFGYKHDFKIKLFKLHGSIDWRIYDNKDFQKTLVKVPKNWKSEKEYSLYPPLLIGTNNKILSYSTQFYLDIFFIFMNLYMKMKI